MKSNPKSLQLVSLENIPQAEDVFLDDLIGMYKVFVQLEYNCTAANGIGLSATQLGIPFKMFVVLRDQKYEYYLNCEYEGHGEKSTSIEGCLSLKDENGNIRRFEVERYSSVTIKGKQLFLSDSFPLSVEDINRTETGLFAVVFQHEIDHFSGREKMIDKIGKEIELLR